ncbi:MAG: LexA family transcriptional regulator [Cytophagales bacterium]|nr:MAG: LexA family transcriptional regulator [Cytophagales bacterium]
MSKLHQSSIQSDSIQHRLRQLFDELGLTIYQIAKDTDENPSKFYNILNGRAKPSYDTILNLLEQYPQISADFIFRGVRPILLSDTRKTPVLPDPDVVEIPFVPVRFYASFIESLGDSIQARDLETFGVGKSLARNHPNAVVIEISGNSMSPQLVSGAKVMAVPVDDGNWVYQSGGVFAVMYRDYLVIKRIRENNLLTQQHLTLYSDHPNGGSVTVHASDLRGLWKVVRIVEAPVE